MDRKTDKSEGHGQTGLSQFFVLSQTVSPHFPLCFTQFRLSSFVDKATHSHNLWRKKNFCLLTFSHFPFQCMVRVTFIFKTAPLSSQCTNAKTKSLKLFSNIFQLQVVLIEIIRLCSLEYNKCVYIILALVFAFMSWTLAKEFQRIAKQELTSQQRNTILL
jgi:hypothetical protein